MSHEINKAGSLATLAAINDLPRDPTARKVVLQTRLANPEDTDGIGERTHISFLSMWLLGRNSSHFFWIGELDHEDTLFHVSGTPDPWHGKSVLEFEEISGEEIQNHYWGHY